jgi:hypothetical protein
VLTNSPGSGILYSERLRDNQKRKEIENMELGFDWDITAEEIYGGDAQADWYRFLREEAEAEEEEQ